MAPSRPLRGTARQRPASRGSQRHCAVLHGALRFWRAPRAVADLTPYAQMSSRKTSKGAKVDKVVHDQLATEFDASKQEIVRLEEENKHLTKELKAT